MRLPPLHNRHDHRQSRLRQSLRFDDGALFHVKQSSLSHTETRENLIKDIFNINPPRQTFKRARCDS